MFWRSGATQLEFILSTSPSSGAEVVPIAINWGETLAQAHELHRQ